MGREEVAPQLAVGSHEIDGMLDFIKFREPGICLRLLHNRRKKKYGLNYGNSLSFEHLHDLISNLEPEKLEKLVNKKILRQVQSDQYEFITSKIPISGTSRLRRSILEIASKPSFEN